MKVLFLSNNWEVARPLADWLSERAVVTRCEDHCTAQGKHDLGVSYCYRKKISETYLSEMLYLNLHNSLLPWGRGVEPLFFAAVEGEPIGVSIHWMDETIDGGKLIVQRELSIPSTWTLREAYAEQHEALQRLFRQYWPYISQAVGSCHSMDEWLAAKDILGPEGWDATIETVRRRWRA